MKAKYTARIPSLKAEIARLERDFGFSISERVRTAVLAECGKARAETLE